jgi:hypothetical protein
MSPAGGLYRLRQFVRSRWELVHQVKHRPEEVSEARVREGLGFQEPREKSAIDEPPHIRQVETGEIKLGRIRESAFFFFATPLADQSAFKHVHATS